MSGNGTETVIACALIPRFTLLAVVGGRREALLPPLGPGPGAAGRLGVGAAHDLRPPPARSGGGGACSFGRHPRQARAPGGREPRPAGGPSRPRNRRPLRAAGAARTADGPGGGGAAPPPPRPR